MDPAVAGHAFARARRRPLPLASRLHWLHPLSPSRQHKPTHCAPSVVTTAVDTRANTTICGE